MGPEWHVCNECNKAVYEEAGRTCASPFYCTCWYCDDCIGGGKVKRHYSGMRGDKWVCSVCDPYVINGVGSGDVLAYVCKKLGMTVEQAYEEFKSTIKLDKHPDCGECGNNGCTKTQTRSRMGTPRQGLVWGWCCACKGEEEDDVECDHCREERRAKRFRAWEVSEKEVSEEVSKS